MKDIVIKVGGGASLNLHPVQTLQPDLPGVIRDLFGVYAQKLMGYGIKTVNFMTLEAQDKDMVAIIMDIPTSQVSSCMFYEDVTKTLGTMADDLSFMGDHAFATRMSQTPIATFRLAGMAAKPAALN